MSGEQKILYDLSKTLKEISENAANSFSGLGIVIYNEIFDHDKYRFGMRPSEKCLQGKYLGNPDTIEYILELSEYSNPSHDGFTFFDGHELTHIAQYFAPPPVKTVKPNELYGSRFHTALFGTYLKGIDAIGTISANGDHFIFNKLLEQNGIKIMGADEIKEYIEMYEGAMKNINKTCEIPQKLKQLAMFLILTHIFKNPFDPHFVQARLAFGI